MNKDDQRAEFEIAYLKCYPGYAHDPKFYLRRNHPEKYAESNVQHAWALWQARSSLDAELVEALEYTDRQIYDMAREHGAFCGGAYGNAIIFDAPHFLREFINACVEKALAKHKGKD